MTVTARSPEECDHLFAETVNAGDLEALVALYEPTCSLVQRNGSVAVGRAEIRAVLGRLLAMQARIATEIVKVTRAGEELAMVYNDWRMAAHGPDGRPIEASGRAIEVVRRQPDGTWLFALDDPFARG
jgi:uncharacterized protein (TIGR02246 family)